MCPGSFVKMMREAAKVKLKAANKEADRHEYCQFYELYRSAVIVAEAEYNYWNELSKAFSITLGEDSNV